MNNVRLFQICLAMSFGVFHVFAEMVNNGLPVTPMKEEVRPAAKQDSADTTAVDPDSVSIYQIQQRAYQLEQQAHEIYLEAHNLFLETRDLIRPKGAMGSASSSPDISLGREIAITARSFADSIQIITKETARAFLDNFSGKKRNARERGFGGCIGPALTLMAVNTEPIRELIRMDSDLQRIGFTLGPSYRTLITLGGGFIYGGVGNGLRVGGAGRSGTLNFQGVHNDTNYLLGIDLSFGGFLIEKSMVSNNMNYLIGGVFGGGAYTASLMYGEGAFAKIKNIGETNASFVNIEVHGGFTYTLAGWFHCGPVVSLPLFFSAEGFKNSNGIIKTNGFMTFNPTLQVRFVFGNLG